ncbi:prepilin-type N-terminal cleavage/methylation domain-containing protein [Petrocella sp. FN5]|uniref:prepilin-type N-terminal cleavage/methylation domain-containing protein n=1 Tax=Petrocella sp. FN5 TaxID=3032002 RepID=UPI0023DBCD06|nr:prepilin-type N-terminal cleavage/methylation domain-containing protein [Petrocella sp. FN5]MDF1617031.1 prepilin-type N-terminal cleavage/methylation domain-containing protein [Petrocella sp. FN5]
MRELFKRVFKKEEGFSLIELIIVIAILAIIAAIAVPNLLNNIQRANEGTDISNAKLIGDAVATVIAQNPDLEGSSFTDIALGSAYTDPSDQKAVLEFVEEVFGGDVPEIKSSRFKHGTDVDFYVTLETTGVITVENGDNVEIFPTP